ncbi:DUF1488 family protein [Herbaspirillum sp. GCM10030257]|uniref:DUF1488 family protein n=1 Tax=Herbaspirillum sp. GCM10030257 TaxID=3273393 RepID=UPI00360FEA91
MSEHDPTRGLWFSFHVDEEEFIAFVSAEALKNCFNASGEGDRHLLRAYTENQSRIDTVARQRFMTGAPRPIRLSMSDFL